MLSSVGCNDDPALPGLAEGAAATPPRLRQGVCAWAPGPACGGSRPVWQAPGAPQLPEPVLGTPGGARVDFLCEPQLLQSGFTIKRRNTRNIDAVPGKNLERAVPAVVDLSSGITGLKV